MFARFFTPNEIRILGALAAFGLVVPNGVFIYTLLVEPETMRAALTNPLSSVFIFEAFFLMFVVAWLIRRAGLTRPSALGFIVMSLVGSMAFSVPATLWLVARKADKCAGRPETPPPDP